MNSDYDVTVIGAGHNGLVCAAYLAKAGLRVLVVERRPVVGGACVTEETFPGVKFSTAANHYGMLRPEIIQDLDLRRFGLDGTKGEVYTTDPYAFLPFPDGEHFIFWRDPEQLFTEVARFSERDANNLGRFFATLNAGARALRRIVLNPPVDEADMRSRFTEDEYALLDRFQRASIGEILDEYFDSEYVKAAFAIATILFKAGPYTPGTALSLLYLNLAEVDGQPGSGFAKGGMGRVTQALRQAAESFGVEVETSAEVRKILVKNGQARGVELADGNVIYSKVVVSNADPKRTFLTLVGPDHLPQSFVSRINALETEGICSKLNCVLTGLPEFEGYKIEDCPDVPYQGTTIIGSPLDYVQKAYGDARRGEASSKPYLELVIQSFTDDSLAPPNKHYLSVFVQFTPYYLRRGSWADPDFRKAYEERIIDTISEYAPNIKGVIAERDFLTPLEIERRFGMTEGNPDHINMSPKQVFYHRPLPGWADYRTPVKQLYLCGAGTQPGGLVSGAPGHNSAMRVLDDLFEV